MSNLSRFSPFEESSELLLSIIKPIFIINNCYSYVGDGDRTDSMPKSIEKTQFLSINDFFKLIYLQMT